MKFDWKPIVRWLAFAACAVAAGALSMGLSAPEPLAAPDVLAPSSNVDTSHCAQCHPDIYEPFQSAPHSFTLRSASDRALWTHFRGKSVELAGDTFRFEEKDGKLRLISEKFPKSVTVDWLFGSGHHAITPVSILENPSGETELSQLNVSWGRIDFRKLKAGVTCTRCHLGAAEHAASEGESRTQVDWRSMSATDSIDRCGECHRRWDEFTPDELMPDNLMLTRFAPVGLSQSPCFQAQGSSSSGARFDCMTCHDPHRSAVTDAAFYVERCLNCHKPESDGHVFCTASPPGSNCLPCHMPKVESAPYLSFTDHWIRVR
jgi:formate-dependent nitrite reductase cytochrome c552 subunit